VDNANPPPPGQTIDLSGTLASGSTYVVCNSNAAADFTNLADLTTGSMTFNGNDAVELVGNGAVLDVIGQIADGNAFGSNTTLVRNSTISVGDTDGTDAFDPTAEWTSFPSNTFADLGMHTFNGVAPLPIEYNFYTGNCGGTLLGTGASYTLALWMERHILFMYLQFQRHLLVKVCANQLMSPSIQIQ